MTQVRNLARVLQRLPLGGHRTQRALASIVVSVCLIAGILVSSTPASAAAAWTQNDWSGGQGPSLVNQFTSSSNVDVSTGNVALAKRSDWYSSAWKYRKQLSFDNSQTNIGVAPQNLSSFAVLIALNSTNFDFTKAQSAGQDIRFADSNGTTMLSYEIEAWDAAAQTATLWVKVPQIDTGAADYIFMYYGNAAANDGQTATGTWDASYTAIWHMKESSGTLVNDSASGGRHGTTNGATSPTAGRFGNARHIGGAGYVSTPLANGATVTISVWATAPSAPGSDGGMLWNRQPNAGPDLWLINNTFYLNTWDSYANPLCAVPAGFHDGAFHNLTTVISAGSTALYVDGVLCGNAAYRNPTGTFFISSGAGYDWKGAVDEVRVSNTVRSSAFIAADFKAANGGFTTYGSEQTIFPSNAGTITSNIFETANDSDWGLLDLGVVAPTGTSVTVRVRAGSMADLSDAPAMSTCATVADGGDLTAACTPDRSRYIQYELTLTTTDASAGPTVTSISLAYESSDLVAPGTPSALVLQANPAAPSAADGSWMTAGPYISWSAASDDTGGSGIQGYCAYVGQDATADPVTTKGLLGASPFDTDSSCQFALVPTAINLATSGVLATALTSSTTPYYLVLKAIDNSNNVSASAVSISFRFDNTAPTPPAFVSAPSTFLATKAVPLIWPSSGGDGPTDATSGLLGLQYRIGSTGIWYGDSHTGTQDINDFLVNDGSYTTQETPDFPSIPDGSTVIYFRSIDVAGNVSATAVSAVMKVNATAPSIPQNLAASPTFNTANAFSFSWDAPAAFQGSPASLTYCYTVNRAPTATNCSYTAPGVTSLPLSAYATQPGVNTLFVVARDEAGNIAYPVYSSIDFTADTPAPGLPQSTEIADVSSKPAQSWKLALSWSPPENLGSGVDTYQVLRSTDGVNYSLVATTGGTSYVDSGLQQVTYKYQVKACDSANNCGAPTPVVAKLPTGRFTEPAALVSEPVVTTSTRKATIEWVTDRNSDSRVQYGTASGQYQSTEASSSEQVRVHALELTNLAPGTVYYYRVRWVDEDGNVGVSAESSFTTAPAPSVGAVTVSDVNVSTATVTFTTTNAVAVRLVYGRSEGFGGLEQLNTSPQTSSYSVRLAGLEDGATYFYKLNTIDREGFEYDPGVTLQFATPARPRITDLRFDSIVEGSSNGERVTWKTNVPTEGELSYGLAGSTRTPVAKAGFATEHEFTLTGLADDSAYALVAKARDASGNVVFSDENVFRTALDTRPPTISNVRVETTVRGAGVDSRGQVVVSWTTDELATSQLAYGEGSAGGANTRSSENGGLSLTHTVVVSDLSTSSIYQLIPIAVDGAGNQAEGDPQTAIIPRGSDNVIAVVSGALRKIFGFLL